MVSPGGAPVAARPSMDEVLARVAALSPPEYVRELLAGGAAEAVAEYLYGLADRTAAATREVVDLDCGTVRVHLTLEVVPTGLTQAEVDARWDAEHGGE